MNRLCLIASLSGIGFFAFPTTIQAWMRTYGGGGSDYGRWVEQTSDGGYVITGTLSPGEFGDQRIYVIKTDSIGDTIWTRCYPQNEGRVGTGGECVQQTSDGGYIIAGMSFVPPPEGVWLIKLDSEGNTDWALPDEDWVGKAYCVRETQDRGYIIAREKDDPPPSGGTDLWLLKTDANGDTLWTRTYGGAGGQWGFSLQVTQDGGSIITGYNDYNLWLLKTDSNGDTLWTRAYNLGDQQRGDRGYSVELTSDGGYIICGATDYNPLGLGALCLLKTDSKGDTLWTRIYGEGGGRDDGRCVQLTSDGGYIITGTTETYGGIWLIKTDSEGLMPVKASFSATPKMGYVPLTHRMQVQFTDQSEGNPDFWMWDFGDGYVSGYQNPTHTYTSAGTFQVSLTVASLTDTNTAYDTIILATKPEEFFVTTSWLGKEVEISYAVPVTSHIELSIYDVNGRLVKKLLANKTDVGEHKISWDLLDERGRKVARGIYFIELRAPEKKAGSRILVTR